MKFHTHAINLSSLGAQYPQLTSKASFPIVQTSYFAHCRTPMPCDDAAATACARVFTWILRNMAGHSVKAECRCLIVSNLMCNFANSVAAIARFSNGTNVPFV